MSTCPRCGADVEQAQRGRRRVWCSTYCRKRQYERPCIDCGTLTNPQGLRKGQGRCLSCMRASRRVDKVIRIKLEPGVFGRMVDEAVEQLRKRGETT